MAFVASFVVLQLPMKPRAFLFFLSLFGFLVLIFFFVLFLTFYNDIIAVVIKGCLNLIGLRIGFLVKQLVIPIFVRFVAWLVIYSLVLGGTKFSNGCSHCIGIYFMALFKSFSYV